jgi:hypothetical protein
MIDAILEDTFKHEALSDSALAAIVKQLCQHPAVQKIINPIVTEDDFESASKYIPENTALSFSITMHAPQDKKMDWPTSNRRIMRWC